MMFGWPSEATARASRSKRRRSASRPSSLIATSRPSSASSAPQTSDIPPWPSAFVSRYRPAITCWSTAIRYARSMGALLSLDQAQALVLARVVPLAQERVELEQAAGRVTAEAAAAAVDLPPFPSSAMDGYAVRAADLPGRLAVVGDAAAGAPAERELGAGEAIAISTGGVVPGGADAVVPVEYVVQYDNEIEVAERVPPGSHVRPRGGDVAAGAVVVGAGVRLGAAQLGALAAAGVASVVCAARPRVAVLATGSELVAPGAPLGPGRI